MSTGQMILSVAALMLVGMMPTWANITASDYRPGGVMGTAMMTMAGLAEAK